MNTHTRVSVILKNDYCLALYKTLARLFQCLGTRILRFIAVSSRESKTARNLDDNFLIGHEIDFAFAA